jgi:hypothetical protein
LDAFLDTTAIVDILFKDRQTVDIIRAILTKYEVTYSSQYVRMEIKRGFLDNYVLLHNKSVECKTLSEVFTYVHRMAATPRRNRLSTMLEAIAKFYAEFETREFKNAPAGQVPTEFQKIMLAAYLRTRIRRFWNAFDKAVDIVIDRVECYKHRYVLQPPKLVGKVFDNTFENCDKYKPGICVLRGICVDEEDALARIQTSLKQLENPDNETQKRMKAIKDVLRVQNREIPRTTCWNLGDAVIVLEAPEGSAIVNGNRKHYQSLCASIGKLSDSYH